MTTDAKEQEILATVAGMIKDVIGEDWTDDTRITMSTLFSYDLEVESIEIVAIAEKIQNHYGERVDFPAWIAGKDLDDIINLTVGQLVKYIASCQ